MNPVNGLEHLTVGAAKINTKQYGSAFISEHSCSTDGYVEFDLNRDWKTLEFTAGIEDGSNNESGRISIALDGRPATFSEQVTLGNPITKSVDVGGALRLRIRVDKGCNSGTVVLAGPQLKR
jgi:hypothetical protein